MSPVSTQVDCTVCRNKSLVSVMSELEVNGLKVRIALNWNSTS